MLRLAKTLPGELTGEVDPEDYGFDVIKEDPPDDQESARRVKALYAQIYERTGVVIPSVDRYLEEAGEGSPVAEAEHQAESEQE